MKKKQLCKLQKYIEKNSLLKLKSYVKKHRLEEAVLSIRLERGHTLLHLACQYGHEAIIRYLLKLGAEPLLANDDGDLPLHLACAIAASSTDSYVYTDLVLPLIDHSPASLDVPNKYGKTCRDMLKHLKQHLQQQDLSDSDTDGDEDSSSSSSSDSDTEGPKPRAEGPNTAEAVTEPWAEKLARELEADQAEQWGNFEEDYNVNRGPETWDDWADRLSSEHSRGRSSWQQYASGSGASASSKRPPEGARDPRRKSRRHEPSEEGTSRPRIPSDKRRAFEENLKKEYRTFQAEMDKCKRLGTTTRKANYEKRCSELFAASTQTDAARGDLKTDKAATHEVVTNHSATESGGHVAFADIPWPWEQGSRSQLRPRTLAAELTDADIESRIAEFLFSDLVKGSELYKKYLKKQQIRWHPDRFVQKCGQRLKTKDRGRILEKVKQISQILNKLSETS